MGMTKLHVTTADEVAAITNEDVVGLYQKYFVPERMELLTICGIDGKEITDLVAQYFGGIRVGNKPGELYIPQNKYFPQGQVVKEIRQNTGDIADIVLSIPGPDPLGQEMGVIYLTRNKLREELSNTIREILGATYTVSIGVLSNDLFHLSSIAVKFTCEPSRADELVNKAEEIIKKFSAGLSQDELNEERQKYNNSADKYKDSSEWWMNLFAGSSLIYGPDYQWYYDENKRIETVGLNEVNSVIKKYYDFKDVIVLKNLKKQ